MIPTILIKVINMAGILIVECRPEREDAVAPDDAFDFQGKQYRIVVQPIHCALTREQALGWATKYAKQPFEKFVDWSTYSKTNALASMNQGLKRTYERSRSRKSKPKKKRQDKHYLDILSDGD